ncbi:unnamed protein product, partial [marine sediment metagenome]
RESIKKQKKLNKRKVTEKNSKVNVQIFENKHVVSFDTTKVQGA